MSFDPAKLHVIEKKTERKAQVPFDLKFNQNSSKFQMSDKFILDNNLSVNGLTFSKYVDGDLILSVQLEENSLFYKKKGSFTKKGKNFKHDVMAKLLVEAGIESGTLIATEVHDADGVKYFSLSQGEVSTEEIEDEDEVEEVAQEYNTSGDSDAPTASASEDDML